nr:MAG TPA: leucine-rich repeat protein [Caudoviricetes sp.]
MSTLIENVAKVEAAHAALKEAISAKGVTVPGGTKLTGMPALVEQIETPPVPTNPRAVFAGDNAQSIVVPKMMVVDTLGMENLSYLFRECNSLTSLSLPAGFGQNATSLSYCFRNCLSLVDIIGNPNFKESLNLSPCTKLTHDSLMVVINGLQTVTTAQTLTLGATNLAKLTDEEKKVATDKGWTLA